MSFEELREQARVVQARELELHPWIEDLRIVGIGWATVELDRAQRELGPPTCSGWDPAPSDAVLGATARRCRDAGGQLILLEPDSEGRVAAFLARFGEGLGAVYLGHGDVPVAIGLEPEPVDPPTLGRRGLGPRGLGPLGSGRLLLGGPRWGPHVVVVEPESTA